MTKKKRTTRKTTKRSTKKPTKKSKEWLKLYDELIDLRENFGSVKKYEEYIDKLVSGGTVNQKDILGSFKKFIGGK